MDWDFGDNQNSNQFKVFCGSLRREQRDNLLAATPAPEKLMAQWGKPGEMFPVVLADGTRVAAQFNGHSQSEKLGEWLDQGWKSADLPATGYTEGRPPRQYEVPKGSILKVLVREIPRKGWVFNVITRPAEGQEREVHPRFPVIIKQRY